MDLSPLATVLPAEIRLAIYKYALHLEYGINFDLFGDAPGFHKASDDWTEEIDTLVRATSVWSTSFMHRSRMLDDDQADPTPQLQQASEHLAPWLQQPFAKHLRFVTVYLGHFAVSPKVQAKWIFQPIDHFTEVFRDTRAEPVLKLGIEWGRHATMFGNHTDEGEGVSMVSIRPRNPARTKAGLITVLEEAKHFALNPSFPSWSPDALSKGFKMLRASIYALHQHLAPEDAVTMQALQGVRLGNSDPIEEDAAYPSWGDEIVWDDDRQWNA
ncbi:hypothetical protein LTR10_003983 [Elasticomyces elasticus]|nr:hypothetical protein LTR10_003983 [Elasticomyces elasticus]KAK4977829.1 hypothetical protein LTR42_002204 [Elasticomyces elasticus]